MDKKKQYDLSAEVYDSRYSEIQREKYAFFLKNIELKEPILDVGCGTGLLKEFLTDKKIFGCDFSEKMLAIAKKRGEIVKLCDLNKKFPYENVFFNTILSFTALQNVEDVNNFLKEAKRILKPNGVFVLTYLNKFDFEKDIKKHFKVINKKEFSEDIGFVLLKR